MVLMYPEEIEYMRILVALVNEERAKREADDIRNHLLRIITFRQKRQT
jgi:hypothetical protein